MREDIIHAIDVKYAPEALIVYGSYADGTEGPDSDFDALAVGPGLTDLHDTSVVCGVRLDLFVYPPERFDGAFDAGEIEQILGGRAVIDRSGIGARLLEAVVAHVAGYAPKSGQEIDEALAWRPGFPGRRGGILSLALAADGQPGDLLRRAGTALSRPEEGSALAAG